MIVGILSDTHLDGVEPRLVRLLCRELAPAQMLLHAGDHVSASVVDYLEYEEPRPYCGVAGNCDPDEVVRRLPARRMMEVEGFRIGMMHGFGPGEGLEERVAALFPERPDILVFGHSHQPLNEQRGGLHLVNPGSAFHPRCAGGGTVALLEFSGGTYSVRLVEVRG